MLSLVGRGESGEVPFLYADFFTTIEPDSFQPLSILACCNFGYSNRFSLTAFVSYIAYQFLLDK